MYGLGHRYGLPWLMRRFPAVVSPSAADRFAERFKTQGLFAVMASRFLPGVRALVPPMAGALGIGAVRAAVAMTLASGLWYGIVCVLAFRAGANAEQLLAHIAEQQRLLAIGAGVLVMMAVAIVVWRMRSSRAGGGQGQ